MRSNAPPEADNRQTMPPVTSNILEDATDAPARLAEAGEAKRQAELAATQVAKYRLSAAAFDRLAAAVAACTDLNKLAGKVLEIFVEVLQVNTASLFLREGERFRMGAAFGFDSTDVAGFSGLAEVAQKVLAQPGLGLTAVSPAGAWLSEFVRNKGVETVHFLPLRRDDQVVGVLYVGTDGDREFSADDKHLLGTLASRSAEAIVHCRACEALEQAVVARDEMIAIVAHDLRNPISVISLAANSLTQRISDSTTRRPVERIVRAAQRAERLLRDLLEVNAIEGGRFSIAPRRLQTATTILAAIESQQSLAASASVILATDLAPELPSVHGDDERLLEVLENLIGNAVKFTNAGGSVTVGAGRRDHDVVVWVKDNGPGIASEQLPHLFDRFWQARKQDRRGTGLGLTICKAIVEAHGGRIWAESTLGAGTTVFFTIPASTTDLQTKGEAPVVASILLVDDRPENLLSLKAILERPDYRLVTATSGVEALGLVLRERFAVALIDIAMPIMDGLEVAVHMKELERCRDIPIIFITAFGDDPKEIHRAYSAGGVDYLVKPLDGEIVRKKVAVFVDLMRRRSESELLTSEAET